MISLDRPDVVLNDFGVSWPHWVREHGPVDRIALISGPEVHGWATPRQIGGYYTNSATRVLGLAAWDDAREGVASGAPWVIFDTEKLLRMLLRQSPLAFRILASHVCTLDVLPADRQFLISAAVTRQMVLNIAAEGSSPSSPRRDSELQTLAELTIGWALARGHADLHAASLLATHPEWSDVDLENRSDVARAIAALRLELQTSQVALPNQPADYEGLSRWLVERRLLATH